MSLDSNSFKKYQTFIPLGRLQFLASAGAPDSVNTMVNFRKTDLSVAAGDLQEVEIRKYFPETWIYEDIHE